MVKDYLKAAGYTQRNSGIVKKLQQGGAMEGGATGAPAAPESAGGQPGGQSGDPMMDALVQVVQTQDPQAALQFCNMLAEQMGIASGGGSAAPAGGSASGGGSQEGAVPVARNGMRIERKRFSAQGALVK